MKVYVAALAPASASEDLVKSLKAAANDSVRLREILQNRDNSSITAAFAALLASSDSSVPNDSTPPKKAPYRPRTPNEIFFEILKFADRDVLDAMQLAFSFMFEFIRDREATVLPLRPISRVQIGKYCKVQDRYRFRMYWLPIVEVVRDSNSEKDTGPKTVKQLVRYLRLGYCESVCFDLRWRQSVNDQYRGAVHGLIFGDLVVRNASVKVLTICVDGSSAFVAHRVFEAFKPLSELVVASNNVDGLATYFSDAFLISAAECGVRSITFDWGSTRHTYNVRGFVVLPVLSFGFAEPTSGGHRSISNLIVYDNDKNAYDRHLSEDYKLDFLAQLVKKARELDGRQHVDLKFTIDQLSHSIDPAGFEKYEVAKCSWLINDLENAITLEVAEAERVVEIHVFSSA